MMKKSDLKTGMVLVFACGKKAVVYKDTIWGDYITYDDGFGHDDLNMLDEDLRYGSRTRTRGTDNKKDVLQVLIYPSKYNGSHLLKANEFDRLVKESIEQIWEREPKPTEMTIKEIEEKLGCKNLKIVKDK